MWTTFCLLLSNLKDIQVTFSFSTLFLIVLCCSFFQTCYTQTLIDSAQASEFRYYRPHASFNLGHSSPTPEKPGPSLACPPVCHNLLLGVAQYEGGVLEMFLTDSQKNYYTAMKKLGRKKPQKVIRRPKHPYHALFYDIAVSRRWVVGLFLTLCHGRYLRFQWKYLFSSYTSTVQYMVNVIENV